MLWEDVMTAWKKFSSAKTLSEIFRLLTWEEIEKLAAVPLFLMMLSPICYFIYEFRGYGWGDVTFFRDFLRYATVLAVPVILLCIGKTISDKKPFSVLIKENQPMTGFAVLALLMLFSTVANGLTKYAVYGFFHNESVFHYLEYIFVFYFSGALIKNTKIKKWYLRIFLMIGIFFAVASLLDYYCFPIAQFRDASIEWKVHAIFSNSNHYGYYLVMVILFSSGAYIADTSRKWKIFYFLSFFINSVVLVLNDAFGAFLACVVGLLFQIIVLWILQHRFSRESAVLLMIFLAVFFIMSIWYHTIFSNFSTLFQDIRDIQENNEGSGDSNAVRWKLWVKTVELIQEKPLLGWGAEGITDILDITCDEYRTHNEFLQYAAFFGIPGGICYIISNVMVFLHGLKYRKQLDLWTTVMLIASLGYLASSFVGNSKIYVTPFFFTILGLGTGIRHQQEMPGEK